MKLSDTLVALRGRAGAFADTITHVSRAQFEYVQALDAAKQAGADQEAIDLQVELACKGRPDREDALNSYAKQLEGGGS